jgi:hypothetical protein
MECLFLVAAPYLFISLSLATLLSKIVHDSEPTYPNFSPSMFFTLISNTISSDIEGLSNNRILGTLLLWAASATLPLGSLLSINTQLFAASVCLISTIVAWMNRNKQIHLNTIILSDFTTYNASTVLIDSRREYHAKRALPNKPRFRRAYTFSGTKHDGSNVNIESCYLY